MKEMIWSKKKEKTCKENIVLFKDYHNVVRNVCTDEEYRIEEVKIKDYQRIVKELQSHRIEIEKLHIEHATSGSVSAAATPQIPSMGCENQSNFTSSVNLLPSSVDLDPSFSSLLLLHDEHTNMLLICDQNHDFFTKPKLTFLHE